MSLFIEGSYHTLKETLQAVNTLISRGYPRKAITLVMNDSRKKVFPAHIELIITTDSSLDLLAPYREEISNGKYLALVDGKSSMNDGIRSQTRKKLTKQSKPA